MPGRLLVGGAVIFASGILDDPGILTDIIGFWGSFHYTLVVGGTGLSVD